MGSMMWLIVAVVVVLLAGLVVTVMIGQSQSNREEDSSYSKNNGRNWANLSWIYLIGMIVVLVIVFWLLK
ncbi:hypothetical protein [Cohnella sp. AR92]|uniref:hypothetical protein n=1 Tax=Cohnella sp. AR92 TaxID=648716 RepID=UPI000F8D0B71|nr:hypothetical protein [Cohnella sp. AR92]RUS46874.1 hypothetical protein ELR57_10715 [Cohnella sp. AR92]